LKVKVLVAVDVAVYWPSSVIVLFALALVPLTTRLPLAILASVTVMPANAGTVLAQPTIAAPERRAMKIARDEVLISLSHPARLRLPAERA
jgi:hypothetical protein